MIKRGKRAAIELSMTTVITIVLSVVFLILALILLRNMYGFQTESIGSIQKKTLDQLNQIYLSGEPTSNLQVQLGEEKTANIRAGTDDFGIGIIGLTISGASIQEDSQMQFALWLDDTSPGNCVALLTKTAVTSWFKVKIGKDSRINAETLSGGPSGGISVHLGIPVSATKCSQKVYVKGWDKTAAQEATLGQDFFYINVLRANPFG